MPRARPRGDNSVSDVAASFYDAALDAECWPQALTALSALFGGNAADLHAGPAGSAPVITATVGISPGAVADYRQHYAALDPVVRAVARDKRLWKRAVMAREAAPDRIERTEFYADWARPNDFDDYLCLALLPSGAPYQAVIGIARPPGAERFGPQEVALLTRLAPHLRRAVEVHRRLALAKTHPAGPVAEALDRLASGVILTDERGTVIWANRAAEALLRAGDGLSLDRRGSLAAATPTASAALLRLVSGAGGGGPGGTLALSRPSGLPALALLAIPLAERRAAEHLAALPLPIAPLPRVLLLLTDPASNAALLRNGTALERRLRPLYGLTRGEALVAAQVARGVGLPEVAAALGVAPTTARTHAQRVYDKMGVRGQAELARLVARLELVLLGGGDD